MIFFPLNFYNFSILFACQWYWVHYISQPNHVCQSVLIFYLHFTYESYSSASKDLVSVITSFIFNRISISRNLVHNTWHRHTFLAFTSRILPNANHRFLPMTVCHCANNNGFYMSALMYVRPASTRLAMGTFSLRSRAARFPFPFVECATWNFRENWNHLYHVPCKSLFTQYIFLLSRFLLPSFSFPSWESSRDSRDILPLIRNRDFAGNRAFIRFSDTRD